MSGQSWSLFNGEALELLAAMPDACVDALVTDPPAGISFMGKEWDHDHGGRDGWVKAFAAIFAECLRTMKPGAHGLVWAIPRTAHWTAMALEDAGFEIRDVIVHLFGTGFPKSLDVSKAIDKAAGAEREVVGYDSARARPNRKYDSGAIGNVGGNGRPSDRTDNGATITAPATDAAKQWSGWGTALKPAAEHWILVRKPFGDTVAANVLAHGTGALNIDACRVGWQSEVDKASATPQGACTVAAGGGGCTPDAGRDRVRIARDRSEQSENGRWPANVTLDEEAAAALDAQAGERKSGARSTTVVRQSEKTRGTYGKFGGDGTQAYPADVPASVGGASRFFFCAKASPSEKRLPDGTKNGHPTPKSVALMRWLCRLVTPAGGLILDPFAGSGSTGVAALAEGFRFLGAEREVEYVRIAEMRMVEVETEAAVTK